MQIFVHISPAAAGSVRVQNLFDNKRAQLLGKGVLIPSTLGKLGHVRLYMAMTDPDHVDVLRFNRGFSDPAKQAVLRDIVAGDLQREIQQLAPDKLILTASQFSTNFAAESEIRRLHDFLSQFSSDIKIVLHVDEPARMLADTYAEQLWMGRTASLDRELTIAKNTKDWRQECLSVAQKSEQDFSEIQAPPYWLDLRALSDSWAAVFGADNLILRNYDPVVFNGRELPDEVCDCFDLRKNIGKSGEAEFGPPLSLESMVRFRQMNALFARATQLGRTIDTGQMRKMLGEVAKDGPGLAPGSLSAVSDLFAKANMELVKEHPGLRRRPLLPDEKLPEWQEMEPSFGFRASQYMAVFLPAIDRANAAQKTAEQPNVAKAVAKAKDEPAIKVDDDGLTPTARKIMPPLAKMNFAKLKGGRFEPHNNIGRVNETELAAAYTHVPLRKLSKGNSGNVIVGCMRNEGPYILEWVAYHRAIGVDNFIIYTNGCDDGTSELLDRLQALGVLQHRNNDEWKGNSPQQYALNQSLKEDVIKNAEWIIHIDVDEFINVRTGNGTLQDFLKLVPDATNVAMTWRMFGHNGITRFKDEPVIEQFDTCAPKYCPKPHTVWGFKTMFKNIGAYEKISCHRPNKLDDEYRENVKWFNGSGQLMDENVKDKGWRSEMKSIGYDLLQLNHYALRSAESFLIKRQRGRALHVDRSIGINYWIRMDWSDHTDITIKRNLPRMLVEYNALMADDQLRNTHESAVKWHLTKAAELHQIPEFRDLFEQALETRLDELERVAYALALDMEN